MKFGVFECGSSITRRWLSIARHLTDALWTFCFRDCDSKLFDIGIVGEVARFISLALGACHGVFPRHVDLL
jgi:hypothetical protein